MPQYFISGLEQRHIARLSLSSVVCTKAEVGGEEGFLFSRQDISEVLDLLKAYVESEDSGPSEDVRVLSLGFNPPEVIARDWNGAQPRGFKKIAEEILLPLVGVDIEMTVPHNHPRAVQEDGVFRIMIWSTPEVGLSKLLCWSF